MRLAIPVSLFEGPFFYFVVESVNLLPLYLSKYFELLCFIHSYDDLFNHASYVPCFAH